MTKLRQGEMNMEKQVFANVITFFDKLHCNILQRYNHGQKFSLPQGQTQKWTRSILRGGMYSLFLYIFIL